MELGMSSSKEGGGGGKAGVCRLLYCVPVRLQSGCEGGATHLRLAPKLPVRLGFGGSQERLMTQRWLVRWQHAELWKPACPNCSGFIDTSSTVLVSSTRPAWSSSHQVLHFVIVCLLFCLFAANDLRSSRFEFQVITLVGKSWFFGATSAEVG